MSPRAALIIVAWSLLLTACASAPPEQAAAAPQFRSIAEAQAAADAAREESARIRDRYAAESEACMHRFFANHCANEARIRHNNDLTRSDGERRAAELYIRREQSRMRHEALDARNAQRDVQAADRAADRAASPRDTAPRQAAQPNPPSAHDAPAPRAVDDPAVRAANRAAYERKQQEARDYAEQQAQQRSEAEARRARRRAEREAEAARLGEQRQEQQ